MTAALKGGAETWGPTWSPGSQSGAARVAARLDWCLCLTNKNDNDLHCRHGRNCNDKDDDGACIACRLHRLVGAAYQLAQGVALDSGERPSDDAPAPSSAPNSSHLDMAIGQLLELFDLTELNTGDLACDTGNRCDERVGLANMCPTCRVHWMIAQAASAALTLRRDRRHTPEG